jgi:hypothetical protein
MGVDGGVGEMDDGRKRRKKSHLTLTEDNVYQFLFY